MAPPKMDSEKKEEEGRKRWGSIGNFFKPTKKKVFNLNNAVELTDEIQIQSPDPEASIVGQRVDLAPISEEGEELVCVEGCRKFCGGYSPEVKDIYQQFPFQLLTAMETIVFANNSFHHVDCMKSNYVLQNHTAGDCVNAVCSTLSTNSDMKSIISRSSQPFEQLATYNNRYLNHQQLANKCMSYHQEMRKSRLNIMNMHHKLNRLGRTLDIHQRFMLNISQNRGCMNLLWSFCEIKEAYSIPLAKF